MEAHAPEPSFAHDAASVSHALGGRIRVERGRAGMSIRELARRVNVSHSLISQIERGNVTPSVATLWSIARELELSVADLFSDAEQTRRAGVSADLDQRSAPGPVQPPETRLAITLEGGVRWERLTSAHDEEVDFIHAVYPVGSASCDENSMIRHNGREYGYVLSGHLGVKIGFQEFEVGPEHSVAFDARTPHRLWTIGDEPVHALWMVVRPGQPMLQRAESRRPGPRRTASAD
jgi:transcriptional regulator with XRE-family HTH domain